MALGVFDGSIAPGHEGWWQLRREYQGLSSPVASTSAEFDPVAKNHMPTKVPYMRYFLADILQFQFYRSVCVHAGNEGALSQGSIYGNKKAGAKYWKAFGEGAQHPWKKTLKELTGKDTMDASAIIDDFVPLYSWLQKQNKGKQCGWQ